VGSVRGDLEVGSIVAGGSSRYGTGSGVSTQPQYTSRLIRLRLVQFIGYLSVSSERIHIPCVLPLQQERPPYFSGLLQLLVLLLKQLSQVSRSRRHYIVNAKSRAQFELTSVLFAYINSSSRFLDFLLGEPSLNAERGHLSKFTLQFAAH